MPGTTHYAQVSIFSLPRGSSSVAVPVTIPSEGYLNGKFPVANMNLRGHFGFRLILADWGEKKD